MPTMQDLRLQVYYRLVAAALLGPDAAWGTLPFVHPLPPLQQFISQCVVYMWHLQKRHVEKEGICEHTKSNWVNVLVEDE